MSGQNHQWNHVAKQARRLTVFQVGRVAGANHLADPHTTPESELMPRDKKSAAPLLALT
jgi:hypothetical protein